MLRTLMRLKRKYGFAPLPDDKTLTALLTSPLLIAPRKLEKMIDPFLQAVSKTLPLEILSVSWDNDALILSGENWSFSTVSAWRVSDAGAMQFGCWDDGIGQKAAALVNLKIVSITSRGSQNSIDPVFELSDGRFLEIFSTTILDPWVMRLPDAIYVGGT